MAGRVVTPKVITKFPLEAFHSTYCQWYSVKLNLKPCLGLALPHKETQWRYTQRLLYLLKNPHYLTFHFLNKSEVNKWGLEKQKNTYIHFHCFNSIQYVPKSKVIDWKNESVSDKVINRFDFCQPSWKRNVFSLSNTNEKHKIHYSFIEWPKFSNYQTWQGLWLILSSALTHIICCTYLYKSNSDRPGDDCTLRSV